MTVNLKPTPEQDLLPPEPKIAEWGNAFQVTRIQPSALDALHRDAQQTLPPGHRYEIRLGPRGITGNIRGIAWYAHAKMADEPTWGGHGLKHGFYLIGQYVTEVP